MPLSQNTDTTARAGKATLFTSGVIAIFVQPGINLAALLIAESPILSQYSYRAIFTELYRGAGWGGLGAGLSAYAVNTAKDAIKNSMPDSVSPTTKTRLSNTVGGVVGGLPLFPIELAATWRATLGKQYNNLFTHSKDVIKQHGLPRLFTGLGPTLGRNGVAVSILFELQRNIEEKLNKRFPAQDPQMNTTFSWILAAMIAAVPTHWILGTTTKAQKSLLTPIPLSSLNVLQQTAPHNILNLMTRGIVPRIAKLAFTYGVFSMLYNKSVPVPPTILTNENISTPIKHNKKV